jgi:SAM-dependent methyltransferase
MQRPSTPGEGILALREGGRTGSYAQQYTLTAVDRFGVWLSARQIRRWVPSFSDQAVGDFGCGYHATFIRTVLPNIRHAVLVDVSLASDLKANPKIKAVEGILPNALSAIADSSLDTVMCVSVLEHLWDPLSALKEFHRIVRPDGICLFNVPSWRGKWFLELSAFRLGLSPAAEMNDHKMYYSPRDLWPLLVKAGFRPQDIQCFSHKFSLNTFAACRRRT